MTEPIVEQAGRVVLKPLIFAFGVLAGYFVAWGAVFCVDALTRWVFGTITGPIGWVPFVGKVIDRPILSLEKKLTSYLGGLEAHFDRQMGVRWHSFASLVRQLAADTKAAAIFNYHVADKVATLWGNAATGQLFKQAHKHSTAAQGSAAVALREAIDARQRVQANESSGAGATVVPHPRIGAPSRTYPPGGIPARVAGLEGEMGQVIGYDIPGLRARERWLTDQIGRLWHRTRGERRTIGLGAFTALLTVALGKLGLGNLRCLNRKNALKTVCGMNPNLLEALLAGTAVVGGSISIVKLAEACQEITGACEDGLAFFVRELK